MKTPTYEEIDALAEEMALSDGISAREWLMADECERLFYKRVAKKILERENS